MSDDLKKILEANIESNRAYVRDFLEAKFSPLAPSRGRVLTVDRSRGIVTVEIGPEEACNAEEERFVEIAWSVKQ